MDLVLDKQVRKTSTLSATESGRFCLIIVVQLWQWFHLFGKRAVQHLIFANKPTAIHNYMTKGKEANQKGLKSNTPWRELEMSKLILEWSGAMNHELWQRSVVLSCPLSCFHSGKKRRWIEESRIIYKNMLFVDIVLYVTHSFNLLKN